MRLSAAMLDNIRLRISDDEKRTLLAAAAKRGLTLSEYIREAATDAARRIAA
ncbi:MAG: DUF1778 domain-containing protein [Mesorhizobium sp.]|nr:DUF1778 domain-containing protein [Mesorhizobium sp.]MBN9244235.1 DUF1778 domain-containing protein [Mesorhizobium sp.]